MQKLYPYRFEIFFVSQIAILFGSLVVPSVFFESILSPILFQINLLSGILLISKQKKRMWFFVGLLIIAGLVFSFDLVDSELKIYWNAIEMSTYFLFYVVVTFEIIKQVWRAKQVNRSIIFGLVSGYISLGLIGFFIFLSIEMAQAESFQIIQSALSGQETLTENLMYFSYITLLTIGYGDIIPLSAIARQASILIGLMGQIYLVIITAIVVGKYIGQQQINN